MKKKWVIISIVPVAAILLIVTTLFFRGIISFNHPSKSTYPVCGVDVSSYQGEIDWQVLSGQDIQFAYIKATEGSAYQDERFAANWQNARNTNLRIGAYHFFSFDSSGQTQAENFIKTVPKTNGILPPAVDVEFYGDKKKKPPDREDVKAQLAQLLENLEDFYGRKPVLYATGESYHLYLRGSFDDYDLWIRNTFSAPTLPQEKHWTFWQYTDKEKLKGYHGKEKYIDMNVYNGSLKDFSSY